MKMVTVNTDKKRQVLDITDLVQSEVSQAKKDTGTILVFTTHTTAAVTTADLDPGTDQDYLNAFDKLIPDLKFNHPHNPKHMPDHVLATMIGPSLTVAFDNKQLILGAWQRIILLEFDGPRERSLVIKLLD